MMTTTTVTMLTITLSIKMITVLVTFVDRHSNGCSDNDYFENISSGDGKD